ncbi:MFS transporter [Streptomyces sp. MMG1533]|uniref:MFS transporter n=1 Tax=Streptomyces sp. MMG1533 TaxID=1415546 RepID=UPI000A46EB4F|nr:MFS transporter [Streptomyces sp. MMG1533]
MPLPVFALMLCVFCVGTAEIAIAGILPDVADGLGVSVPSAGLLVTGYAVGVALGGPVITLLTLRVPRKALMVGLMAVFLAGNVGSFLAANYATLMGARIVASLAHGTFVAMAGLVAARMSPPDRQATAIAQVSLGFNLANILGSPLGTLVGQRWGWRATFAALAVTAVASIVLVLLAVPGRIGADDGAGTGAPGGSVRDEVRVMCRPAVLASMAVTVLAQGAVFTTSTYLAPLMRDVSGFPAGAMSVLLAVFGIGAVLGNLAGGRLADRDPTRGAVLCLTALVAVLALFWAVAPHRWPAAAVLLLFGAAGFSIIPVLQSRVLALAASAPLLALSANVSAFNLGNGFGAWLGGAVMDQGWGARSVTSAGCAAAAVALLVIAPMWARQRGLRTRPAEGSGQERRPLVEAGDGDGAAAAHAGPAGSGDAEPTAPAGSGAGSAGRREAARCVGE